MAMNRSNKQDILGDKKGLSSGMNFGKFAGVSLGTETVPEIVSEKAEEVKPVKAEPVQEENNNSDNINTENNIININNINDSNNINTINTIETTEESAAEPEQKKRGRKPGTTNKPKESKKSEQTIIERSYGNPKTVIRSDFTIDTSQLTCPKGIYFSPESAMYVRKKSKKMRMSISTMMEYFLLTEEKEHGISNWTLSPETYDEYSRRTYLGSNGSRLVTFKISEHCNEFLDDILMESCIKQNTVFNLIIERLIESDPL